MPRSGPEYKFSKRIRSELKAVYPDSFVYLCQDAYRSGIKPADFFWFISSVTAGIELKAKPTFSACLNSVSNNQKSSLMALARAGICSLLVCQRTGDGLVKIYKVGVRTWGFNGCNIFIMDFKNNEKPRRYEVEVLCKIIGACQ